VSGKERVCVGVRKGEHEKRGRKGTGRYSALPGYFKNIHKNKGYSANSAKILKK
jgi:hypothetical protein